MKEKEKREGIKMIKKKGIETSGDDHDSEGFIIINIYLFQLSQTCQFHQKIKKFI